MQIYFWGANCLQFKTAQTNIVFDDNLAALKSKPVAKKGMVACVTNEKLVDLPEDPDLVFHMPGSYEVGDVSITGIASQAYTDEKGTANATIFKLVNNHLNVVVLGHIQPDFSETELEKIGSVDILCLPVGGNGYTLDAVGALKAVKTLEPNIVVPTHYAQTGLKFEVPMADYQEFAKILGIDPEVVDGNLKISKKKLTDNLELKVIKS